MNIATAQAFANRKHAAQDTPEAASAAYTAEVRWWATHPATKDLESPEGIWLFFSYDRSVTSPDGERHYLTEQEWQELDERLSQISVNDSIFQGGFGYEVREPLSQYQDSREAAELVGVQ